MAMLRIIVLQNEECQHMCRAEVEPIKLNLISCLDKVP